MFRDARYGLRALTRAPGFTAIVVITLALGVGVNTAVFSVLYAALLRPLPYQQPERLALIWSDVQRTGASRAPASGPALREIQQRSRLLEDVAGIWVSVGTFTGGANPEQVKVAHVTPNFLAVLGARPILGRTFLPEERFGGRPAIVLSNGLWHSRFGADSNIVGRNVRFNDGDYTVVGVLPEDFRLAFPPDSNVPPDPQAFIPFPYDIYQSPVTLYFVRIAARLKPGVGWPQAQQDMDRVAQEIRGAYTDLAAENMKLLVVPMHADAVRDIKPSLMALFAGAAFVLLICCLNTANLLLVRANERAKETAIRTAIGATRGRLLRQLVTEGFLLCAIAGAAGLGVAWGGIRLIDRLRPASLDRIGDIGLNGSVFLFAAAISFGSVLLFALAPAFASSKKDLMVALRESGRGSRTPVRRGVRAALVVAEIMLGFVLVVGAGLMIRTFSNIQRVQPGFEPRRLLTFSVDPQGRRYPSDAALFNFVDAWERDVRALPGVEAVGASSHLPLDDYPNWYSPYRPEGVTPAQGAALLADHRAVTREYLQAMGTRLLEGRYFDEHDRQRSQKVVIVDDLLAKSTWPGQSAIGKKLEAEHNNAGTFEPEWAEVVGVVEHVRNHSLSKRVRPEIYIPLEQSPRTPLAFAVRTQTDPASLIAPLRQLLRQRDPDLAMSKTLPMTVYVENARAPATFTAVLAAIFAGLALTLAVIGVYGVIAYSVSRRRQEFGIRMALGASPANVVRIVLREGMSLAGLGLMLGIAGALAASRPLQGLIYGVPAIDPLTYTAAIIVIPVAALMGCLRPAAKAVSIDPVEAIRAE